MAITVEEIWKDLLVRSGRFILEPSNVKLDQVKLVPLVEDALRFFSKYCPCVEHFNLAISGEGSGFYTFTDEFSANGKTLGIPHMIADAVPVQLLGSVPLNVSMIQLYQQFNQKFSYGANDSVVKCEFPVAYRKPTLYVPLSGTFDIQAVFIPQVVKKAMTGENEGMFYWELETVDNHDPTYENFFELLHGLFLNSLAKSQRAFTIEDLPIRTDADTLASEGERIEERAKEAIIDNDHAFYLAWT